VLHGSNNMGLIVFHTLLFSLNYLPVPCPLSGFRIQRSVVCVIELRLAPLSSTNVTRVIKSRIMSWEGHVTRMRDRRGARGVLVGRSDVKRPLDRPRHRREDNIKIDLQDV
jgi:hypothetical protein